MEDELQNIDEAPQELKRSSGFLSKSKSLLFSKRGLVGVAVIVIIATSVIIVALATSGRKEDTPKTASAATVIRFFSGEYPEDQENSGLPKLLAEFTKETNIKVEMVYAPESVENFTDTGQYVLDDISKESPTLDVVIVDGTWTGWLNEHLLDLKPYVGSSLNQHFPQMVAAATLNGKIIAEPYFQDISILFYRKDLLAKYGYSHPPTTWDELETMARTIQDGERKTNSEFWGYLWEADASESLTATALEMQSSYGGGTIIDNNKVTVNNAATVQALAKAKSWIGTISPMNTLRATEEDVLSGWSVGNAAFMRNWLYVCDVSKNESPPIADKFDISALPGGPAKRVGTLGGEYLGVAAKSKHPKEAAALVKYLTGKNVQKQNALDGTSVPSIPALFDDTDVLKANPYYPKIKTILSDYGISRPALTVHDNYNELPTSYFNNVHDILSGKVTTQAGLQTLEDDLVRITGFSAGSL